MPSSSTPGLNPPGIEVGNVDGLGGILHEAVRNSVRQLHVSDLEAGCGAIVTATCGGHPRLARPDAKKPYPQRVQNRAELDDYYLRLNVIATKVALEARERFGNDSVPVFGSVLTSGDSNNGKIQLQGSEAKLIQAYTNDHRAQLEGLQKGHVDAVLVEAGGVSVPELIAIAQLCKELCLPVLMSLVVGDDGRILDPNSNDNFSDLARQFRGILENKYLGLGLNCNSHRATKKALEQDPNAEIKVVYPNQDQGKQAECERGIHNYPATIEEEIGFLKQLLVDRPDLAAIGSCCRSVRSEELLRRVTGLL